MGCATRPNGLQAPLGLTASSCGHALTRLGSAKPAARPRLAEQSHAFTAGHITWVISRL